MTCCAGWVVLLRKAPCRPCLHAGLCRLQRRTGVRLGGAPTGRRPPLRGRCAGGQPAFTALQQRAAHSAVSVACHSPQTRLPAPLRAGSAGRCPPSGSQQTWAALRPWLVCCAQMAPPAGCCQAVGVAPRNSGSPAAWTLGPGLRPVPTEAAPPTPRDSPQPQGAALVGVLTTLSVCKFSDSVPRKSSRNGTRISLLGRI